jgi:hypothetical protein
MPFKPGEVNNPNGARKERLFYNALRLALDEKRLRRIAEKLVKAAEAGVPWAIRELIDRTDGKPVQAINVDREERIKLIAVVPQKAATTEEWLKLVGEQRVIEHQPTDLESTE